MFEFDTLLAGYCLAGSVIYTRYADDIALSASEPRRLDLVHASVGSMKHLGLSLNETKTVNVSKKYRRTLTGLTLGNDATVSVGREKKRLLRSALHKLSRGEKPEMPIPDLNGWKGARATAK